MLGLQPSPTPPLGSGVADCQYEVQSLTPEAHGSTFLAMRNTRYVVAAAFVLVGLVFIGQGVGLIPGSFMTGEIIWAVIGAGLILAGAALVWLTRRSTAS